jgi:hypothetical protein
MPLKWRSSEWRGDRSFEGGLGSHPFCLVYQQPLMKQKWRVRQGEGSRERNHYGAHPAGRRYAGVLQYRTLGTYSNLRQRRSRCDGQPEQHS